MTKKKDNEVIIPGLQKAPRMRKAWERERCPTPMKTESVTDQTAAGETDVNTIVQRFQRTGHLPPGKGPGMYADVSEIQGDLTERLIWAKEQVDNLETAIQIRAAKEEQEKAEAAKKLEEQQQADATSSSQQVAPEPAAEAAQ